MKQKTQEEDFVTKIAKMTMVMNKGVKTRWKVVTTQVFTTVGLFVEISTSIEKSKSSIEVPPSLRQPSVIVTSNSPVTSSSFFSFFFFGSTLQSHL